MKKHIADFFPFLPGSKLLLAVSGGVDSVVLTHIFHQLGFEIALAHVNFNLRENESDADEKFVLDLGKKLQVPVFVYKADTLLYAEKHKLSVQMAARAIRYRWFDELLHKKGFDYVLTAHHLDDTVESFFINLSRGTGIDGLTGIPAINNTIIRPLLPFDRKSIVLFAKQQGIVWREDSSNASVKYVRNRIRHKLIPVLEVLNPDFRKTFVATQNHLRDSKNLVADYLELLKKQLLKKTDTTLKLDIDKWKNIPHNKAVLYELFKEYGFTQWDDIYDLVDGQTGKRVYSKTHFLLKDRDFLQLGVISKQNTNEPIQIVDTTFHILGKDYVLKTLANDENYISKSPFEVAIDKSKIQFPLFVRKWKKGDYFYPLGMEGKKKLSDFMIDLKISRLEKEKIYLLCDAQDTIIWVINKRLDNRFRITKTTKEILKITSNDEKNI